jgi:hypothetical protein
MAYIKLDETVITTPVPILKINDTLIFREATLKKMEYDRDLKQVVLLWTIKHYSLLNGGKGDSMGTVTPDDEKRSIADNSTMCDVTNGHPIYPDADGNYDQSITYTGQYDFFTMMGEQMPVLVHSLIRQFGALIDWNK